MTPWVARLIFLNVLVYGLTLVVDGLGNALAFIPVDFLFRPWTIVTYMFVHSQDSIWHIVFNMLILFFFGPRIEARLGGRRFLCLYFTSGIVGGLLSFTTPEIGVIGASGATYGVMFAFAHFWPREVVHIWGVLPVEVRWLVTVMIASSLFFGFTGGGGGVAHFAHLGGVVGAWIYLKVLERTSGARRFQAQATQKAPAVSSAAAVARWSHIQREGLHPVNLEELDRVMAKLKEEGVARLTDGEKEFLERFSKR